MTDNTVQHRIQDIYRSILALRTPFNRSPYQKVDRLLFIWDSAGDVKALRFFIEEAQKSGVFVRAIYCRTIMADDMSLARAYLTDLAKPDLKTEIMFLDYTISDSQTNHLVLTNISSFNPTIGLSNISDAYDLRELTYQACANPSLPFSILEMPTITLKSLTSNMFKESHDYMVNLGNDLIACLQQYDTLLFEASDGMHLLVNPSQVAWVNEAWNDFKYRAAEQNLIGAKFEAIADNPPGEICTNVRSGSDAHKSGGTWILYQLDEDVIKWGERNGFSVVGHLSWWVYNPDDPIAIEVDSKGYVITSSINGSIRAQILKAYLEQKDLEDIEATLAGDLRPPKAALKISEFGLGINRFAENPEQTNLKNEHITSVLITEKVHSIFHLAIGKSINDDPGFENYSGSHIDNGLRNPDLHLYGLKHQAKILLYGQSEVGELNRIFNAH